MKRSAKLSVFFLVLILVCSMFVLPASAATTTQDGLEVTLTADKTEYKADEQINAKLTVKNKEAVDVSSVSLEALIPDGYKLADNTSGKKTVGILKSGDSAELSVTYIPSKDLNVTELSNNTNNNTSSNSSATTTTNTTESKTEQSDTAMKTGDTHYYDTYLLLFIVSGVLVFVMLKKKKGKQLLSILLCVTLIGAIVPMGDIMASADQITSTITVSNVVKVNGKELKHEAKVSYLAPEEDDTELKLNLDNFMYDESSNKYYAFNYVDTLEGRVKNPDDVKKLSYSVKDVNDKVLLSGDLSPKSNTASKGANPIYASGAASGFRSNFTIDKFALIIGENTVKVEVEYKNGDKFSVEVVINNVCEENMTSLNVDMGDDDNDGVLNFIEELYHSDPKNADADKDGLDDYYEMAIFGTDPNKADSNDNGISDADEDMDSDGLSNIDEITKYNTDPLSIDGDGDGLTDYDEVTKYKTDPTNADCDGDGASDGWEVQYGFDPLTPDSDFGEYSLDGDSTVKNDDGSEITIVFDDEFINESTPGYMGFEPIHVELGNNTTTNISIQYDPSTLSGEDAPTIYYFNEEKQVLEEVPTTVTDDGKATATIDKSGTYVLLNRRYVYDVWENDIIETSDSPKREGKIDMVFVIDRSASMKDNDPNEIRKKVVNEFINRLRNVDQAAVVQFSATAETIAHLTNDKEELINAVNGIQLASSDGCSDPEAGTNGAAGLRYALMELENSKAENKYIVFLTDGYDDVSGSPEYFNTYPEVKKDAIDNEIAVYTIGLVGTGSVNIDLLKDIAESTGGKYYLATEGTEAENTPEGIELPGLEEVYDDIADQTISRVADSNNDGITDYYTKLMCEGVILTSKGTKVFGDATYEQVQSNADFDGDGLINGTRRDSNTNEIIEKGEIDIIIVGTSVYAKVYSYPDNKDSDGDGIGDYEETINYLTSPLKYNTNILASDVEWMTNNNNFMSCKYLNYYNSNDFERESVKIGNGFFGNAVDQTILYQKILEDYFEQLDKELLQQRGLDKYNELNKQAYYALIDQIIDKLQNSISSGIADNDDTIEGILESISNLKSVNDIKNFEAIDKSVKALRNFVKGENFLDIGKDLSMANKEAERLRTLIKSIPPGDDDFYNRALSQLYDNLIQNSVKVDKLNFSMSENPFKLTKVGIAFDVVSVIHFGLTVVDINSEETKRYCSLLGNLDLLCDNIYVLNTIISTSDNEYLSKAAKNLQKIAVDVLNNNVDLMQIKKSYDNTATQMIGMEALHTVMGSELAQYAVSFIPYVGQVIAAAMVITEAARDVGNIFFHMDSISKGAAYIIASSQTAAILSKHYSNHLNGGDAINVKGSPERWIAFSDYSEELYTYYLNLSVIRKMSECYMQTKKGDKDSEGNDLDYFFTASKDCGIRCRQNMDRCDILLDNYSGRLRSYYKSIT